MRAADPETGSRAATNTIEDGVALLSRNGRVAQVTVSLGHTCGTSSVDRPFADLLAEADRATFEQARTTAQAQGRATTCTAALRTVEDEFRTCEVRVEPPSSPGGLTVVVVRDITAVQRPRQEAALLRRITEAANSTSQTSLLFDRAVADVRRTMGWPHGHVVEPRDDSSRASLSPAATRACATGEPVAMEGTVVIPTLVDDEVTTLLEFPDTGTTGFDADLLALFRNLGRQLGSVVEREQVRRQLDEQARELERSNGELERFAYIASHDLQEPLRKVVGFGELVEQRYADRLDDSGREYLGYVVDGARRMQRLIKDLLVYSRAGRARPTLEAVDLDELAAQVLDTLQWHVEEAGARVTVGPLPTVTGDAGQLAEVLTNLLSNALKYADGAATIDVAAEAADEPGWWEVTVADDGIGIDPRYAEQVFEVFRRLHGPTEYPGTGIGLAVTKKFVEAHRGRVWVTPNHPRGSTFHLTLPATRQEPA